jgi:hypothetical protein
MRRHFFDTTTGGKTACKRHYLLGINPKFTTMARNKITCAGCRKALGLKPLAKRA